MENKTLTAVLAASLAASVLSSCASGPKVKLSVPDYISDMTDSLDQQIKNNPFKATFSFAE